MRFTQLGKIALAVLLVTVAFAGTLANKSFFCWSVKFRARAMLPHVPPGMPPPP